MRNENATNFYILILQPKKSTYLNDFFSGKKNDYLSRNYGEYRIYSSLQAITEDKDATSLTGLQGIKRYALQLEGSLDEIINSMQQGFFHQQITGAIDYDLYVFRKQTTLMPNPYKNTTESLKTELTKVTLSS